MYHCTVLPDPGNFFPDPDLSCFACRDLYLRIFKYPDPDLEIQVPDHNEKYKQLLKFTLCAKFRF